MWGELIAGWQCTVGRLGGQGSGWVVSVTGRGEVLGRGSAGKIRAVSRAGRGGGRAIRVIINGGDNVRVVIENISSKLIELEGCLQELSVCFRVRRFPYSMPIFRCKSSIPSVYCLRV